MWYPGPLGVVNNAPPLKQINDSILRKDAENVFETCIFWDKHLKEVVVIVPENNIPVIYCGQWCLRQLLNVRYDPYILLDWWQKCEVGSSFECCLHIKKKPVQQ